MKFALKFVTQNDRHFTEVILQSLGLFKHYFTTLLKNTGCIVYSSLVYVVRNFKAVLPTILISLLLRMSLNPFKFISFNIMLQNIVYVFPLLDFTDMFAEFHRISAVSHTNSHDFARILILNKIN